MACVNSIELDCPHVKTTVGTICICEVCSAFHAVNKVVLPHPHTSGALGLPWFTQVSWCVGLCDHPKMASHCIHDMTDSRLVNCIESAIVMAYG